MFSQKFEIFIMEKIYAIIVASSYLKDSYEGKLSNILV